jgi:hypothetical protein
MHAKKDLNPKFTFSNRGPKSPPVIYGTALFLPPVFVYVGTHSRKTKRKAAGSHGLQGPCLHRSSRARRRPGSCGGAKGARAPAPGDWAAASDNQEGSPCARRLLRRPAAATAGPEAPARSRRWVCSGSLRLAERAHRWRRPLLGADRIREPLPFRLAARKAENCRSPRRRPPPSPLPRRSRPRPLPR